MLNEWDVAVVDLETTGVELGYHHRVVEIGIVRYEPGGKLTDTFESLVNPKRDIGNSHIHGITARDVRDAPVFSEIAGSVLEKIGGTVVVAHNVDFDVRFLTAEYERCGIELPPVPCACTLRLASQLVSGLQSRKLSDICEQVDIDLRQGHTAMDDARATGRLFERCVERLGGWEAVPLDKVGCSTTPTPLELWPEMPTGGRVYTRKHAQRTQDEAGQLMAGVIGRLPRAGTAKPELAPYMALLDRVLEDRRVSTSEARELLDFAGEMGMSRQQMRAAHRRYLQDVIQVAIEDQVISSLEEKDIEHVRVLLDLSREDYQAAMEKAVTRLDETGPLDGAVGLGSEDLTGKTVCFTGSFQSHIGGEKITRKVAQSLAREGSLQIRQRVTKDLDVRLEKENIWLTLNQMAEL